MTLFATIDGDFFVYIRLVNAIIALVSSGAIYIFLWLNWRIMVIGCTIFSPKIRRPIANEWRSAPLNGINIGENPKLLSNFGPEIGYSFR